MPAGRLISGRPAYPGWVVPSMRTLSVKLGNEPEMVCTPAPGMLKVMTSAPGLLLALAMAWLNEPAPELAVLVTTKVVARAELSGKTSATATNPRQLLQPTISLRYWKTFTAISRFFWLMERIRDWRLKVKCSQGLGHLSPMASPRLR